MSWHIKFTQSAKRQFQKLPREIQNRINTFMQTRAALKPREYGKPLKGAFSENWCYRVGAYRVICSLHDDVLIIEVVKIGPRKNIYKQP